MYGSHRSPGIPLTDGAGACNTRLNCGGVVVGDAGAESSERRRHRLAGTLDALTAASATSPSPKPRC